MNFYFHTLLKHVDFLFAIHEINSSQFFLAIRLRGTGATSYSGRVEVYYNNQWGTICDDSFGTEDAQVLNV